MSYEDDGKIAGNTFDLASIDYRLNSKKLKLMLDSDSGTFYTYVTKVGTGEERENVHKYTCQTEICQQLVSIIKEAIYDEMKEYISHLAYNDHWYYGDSY